MMERVVYEEITRLEAMAKIDVNDVSDLYFVDLYYESDIPYGENPGFIHYPAPRDFKQTEPILYHSEFIIQQPGLFKKRKKILAEPKNTFLDTINKIYIGHRWVVKTKMIMMDFSPPSSKNEMSDR